MAQNIGPGGHRPGTAHADVPGAPVGGSGGRTLVTTTAALGLVSAVVAPFTVTAAQFVTSFLGGAFLGAFTAVLRHSVSEVGDLDSAATALEAVYQAAVGAVLAVAASVLVVGLGTYGWTILISATIAWGCLRVLLRRWAAPPPLRPPENGIEDLWLRM